MLAGDVESNPCPMTKNEAESFAAELETICKLEGHASLSEEIKRVSEKQETCEITIRILSGKVETLEAAIASRETAEVEKGGGAVCVSDQLTAIASRSVESNWVLFRDKLTELVSKHVPFVTITNDKKNPWFTRKHQRMSREIKRLYTTAKHDVYLVLTV
ncbi:hypothetical protein HPB50_027151 [Hyalomma asiaticum]|uniref:Uncharacterized protein n=1 Tax=Hyalomma asiaticum TaxID=266040 RepID=A0ACB7TRY0_HYAAI|nr:hypothetical protein HPB50_027151 [Hyalomma asiaticum]